MRDHSRVLCSTRSRCVDRFENLGEYFARPAIMRLRKIVCPIDFSHGSRPALHTAARFAHRSDGELVVAHAWYIPGWMLTDGYVFPPHVIQEIIEEAQAGLDAAVREVGPRVRATPRLVQGDVAPSICEIARNEQADLMVIGTHGRTGLARIFLGSIAEKVIRHAPCSVLVVRGEGREPQPIRHVLCAIDFSPSSERALELAASLIEPPANSSRLEHGGLDLLNVIELPVAISGRAPMADLARDFDRRGAAALEAAAERARRITDQPVRTSSRIGYAGAQILAAIEDDPSIDLVVVGSHGRTGVKRALGSVAEKVARHARCPVLVAR